jgi:hypothetical protein
MKMPYKDEWGHDPSVQSLRQTFSYIEKAQHELLMQLNISLFDKRLRSVRKQTLELFERAWPLAVRQGIIQNEKEAAPLYLHCLTRALSSVGVRIPKELSLRDEKITCFLKEKLP